MYILECEKVNQNQILGHMDLAKITILTEKIPFPEIV